MKVYIFGNEDLKEDGLAFKVAKKLKNKIEKVSFIKVMPNADLPFTDEKFTVIMDTAFGIDEITEITDLDNFKLSSSSTVHDFDLAFQLKYLRKIGRLGRVLVIALPMNKEKIDYLRIQSILRKLVAQDMQGS